MHRQLLSVAVAGLMAGAVLGADVSPGLKPGDKVSVFNPLNVTGRSAGEKACQI